jgi:transcriptional regulator with XRE-family HTH domain
MSAWLHRADQPHKVDAMSELIKLVQQYLDKHNVRDAAFARNIGASPQAISKWRKKPDTFPEPEHLQGVARVTGVPYLVVLDAALLDAGYRESLVDDVRTLRTRLARLARVSDERTMQDLEEFIQSGWIPPENVDDVAQPGMHGPAIDAAVREFFRRIDEIHGYGNDEMLLREIVRAAIGERVTELEEHDAGELPDDSQTDSSIAAEADTVTAAGAAELQVHSVDNDSKEA